MVDFARINNTMGKFEYHLSTHNSIVVGVSGGLDSTIIVHMICTYFRQYLDKIHFAFSNTGLEYRATLRFLDELEQKYNIKIDRIRGDSVVTAVRKYGVPIKSKEYSQYVKDFCNDVPYAIKWFNGEKPFNERRYKITPKQKSLCEYIKEHNISVSKKCCDISKKRPFNNYMKQHNADLRISGERKVEGGVRAASNKDCFAPGHGKHIDKYMPLFFWDDETKQYYKEHEGIKYSDCYEVWGMRRTGCVGCPFNLQIRDDLKTIQKYEPLLYQACMNVFGESYRLMDKFHIRRKPILKETYEEVDRWESDNS